MSAVQRKRTSARDCQQVSNARWRKRTKGTIADIDQGHAIGLQNRELQESRQRRRVRVGTRMLAHLTFGELENGR